MITEHIKGLQCKTRSKTPMVIGQLQENARGSRIRRGKARGAREGSHYSERRQTARAFCEE